MADIDSDAMYSPGHDFLREDGYEGATDNDSYENVGAKNQSPDPEPKRPWHRTSMAHEVGHNACICFHLVIFDQNKIFL
jgi:hypothetical protein